MRLVVRGNAAPICWIGHMRLLTMVPLARRTYRGLRKDLEGFRPRWQLLVMRTLPALDQNCIALPCRRRPLLPDALVGGGCQWLIENENGAKSEPVGSPGRVAGRGLGLHGRQGLPGCRAQRRLLRGKHKPESQKRANKVHARLSSPGERANARLKSWRILCKLRSCPWRARPARQSHPRVADPRGKCRMQRVHGVTSLSAGNTKDPD